MTKHAPATPLPFIARDDGKSFGIYYVTRYGSEGAEAFARVATISTKNTGQDADAAYVAHACNAYPQLVDALRNDISAFAQLTAAYPARNGMVNKRLDALHALLRSLDE